MYRFIHCLVCCFGLAFLSNCSDIFPDTLNLDKQEFLQVDFAPLEVQSLSEVKLIATFKDWQKVEKIDERGFLLTTSNDSLSFLFHEEKLPATQQNDTTFTFSALATNLQAIQAYRFRAYVKIGEKVFYSSEQSYKSESGMVQTLSFSYQGGFSITLKGRLLETGTEIIAVQHGFCWSNTNTDPTLSDESINLGTKRNNEPYEARIDDLLDNKPFYFKSYAVVAAGTNQDTLFGGKLTFDGNLNFWEEEDAVTRAIGNTRPLGMSIGKFGYVMMHYRPSSSLKHFIKFDPNPTDGIKWKPVANIPLTPDGTDQELPGGPRWTQASFEIDGFGFIGLGVPTRYNQFARDLWRYSPTEDTFEMMAPFPGMARGRTAHFSLGNKGYVGLGNGPDGAFPLDFWEYTPPAQNEDDGQGTWLKLFDKTPLGRRSSPVAFSIGSKGYVGLGYSGGRNKDFWEFDPQKPKDDQWRRLKDFPGLGREKAMAFVIADVAYVGTGAASSQFKDMYRFDPNCGEGLPGNKEGCWERVADYPDLNLESADLVGFAVAGKGYVGLPNGRFTFWKFTP